MSPSRWIALHDLAAAPPPRPPVSGRGAHPRIARSLYAGVKDLPIVSPHGHTDPAWFATNDPFADPASLLIVPDHYLFRMLYSQGVRLEDLGIPTRDGTPVEAIRARSGGGSPRTTGCSAARLRGCGSTGCFAEVFGLDVTLDAETADLYFDTIDAALKTDAFRPRALFERFGIEVIATTESPLDPLDHHRAIRDSGWPGRVVTAYRPDP
jgi:glucuronate isomerase